MDERIPCDLWSWCFDAAASDIWSKGSIIGHVEGCHSILGLTADGQQRQRDPGLGSCARSDMAVELMMGYANDSFAAKMEDNALQEAASAGIQSVEKLVKLLSQCQQQKQTTTSLEIDIDCTAVADMAVTKFKRVISLLDRTRTGHARFRRAPLVPPQQQPQDTDTPVPVSITSRLRINKPLFLRFIVQRLFIVSLLSLITTNLTTITITIAPI
ncbi:putative WRKY transcription factor 7 [Vitis vinifera]|uniref:Putative WRKY transcription factor 7 n=1 Tax=Vitis vinifera TaxID=29760 RepID=A0A438ITF2_VITVI|nr:putative WRKY transcription factor 7 [Vitis vinifera]